MCELWILFFLSLLYRQRKRNSKGDFINPGDKIIQAIYLGTPTVISWVQQISFFAYLVMNYDRDNRLFFLCVGNNPSLSQSLSPPLRPCLGLIRSLSDSLSLSVHPCLGLIPCSLL